MATRKERYERACRAAARRGARLLDRTRPGWHKRVPITKLRLEDSCNCVLGHLDGHYATGRDRLFVGTMSERIELSRWHGFTVPSAAGWPPLTTAWVDEIRARRAADKVAA